MEHNSKENMLQRSSEFGDEIDYLPIVSICVIGDKFKCPTGFTAILKTHDDASDADLWKDSFGFGIFNRVLRYICVNRQISDTHCLEVVTDLAIISDKEAVPSNFVCIDFTADTKERALKKKYLCARFTPRNDTLDAVTDIIILAKSKKPPKGYTLAGDVDGMMICYMVSTIPESYGRLKHSQSTRSTELRDNLSKHDALYPNVANNSYRHSANDLDNLRGQVNAFTIKTSATNHVKGIDGVPFQLSPLFTSGLKEKGADLPSIPELKVASYYNYNFNLERSIAR